MTKVEKGLLFAARTLGAAMLWGVCVRFVTVPLLVEKGSIALLIAVAAAAWLLLTLAAKLLLRVRYPEAVWKLGRALVSGVLTGFVMAAMLLLAVELMTALVSMMTLLERGG